MIEGYAEEVDGEPQELGEGESGTGGDPGEPLTAEQRSDPEIQRRKRKKRS